MQFKKIKALIFLAGCLSFNTLYSQGLLDELEESTKPEKEPKDYVYATFKSTRIINMHSIEAPAKGELLFMIQHRFGRINQGFYDLFGLDQASVRIGFEYTSPFTDRISLGIGRSVYKKTYDGYVKAKIIKQAKNGLPFSLSYVGSMANNMQKWRDPNRTNYYSSRLSYVNQLLLARKFNDGLSIQAVAGFVHRNLVAYKNEANTFGFAGIGGRIKLTRRVTLNAEYIALLGDRIPTVDGSQKPQNSVAIGFDIETGGHVFQLHFTNSLAMFEQGYISETTGKVGEGDIHFGFNIMRTFAFKKKIKVPEQY